METQTYILLLDKTVEAEKINQIAIQHNFKKDEERENFYFWKGQEYKSIKGCYFSFGHNFNLSNFTDETVPYDMICATSTEPGCSYDDREKQIKIMETIQNLYGGKIYDPNENSWGIRGNTLPKLSKTEIACGIEYVEFRIDLNEEINSIQEVDLSKTYFDWSTKKSIYPRSLIDNHSIVTQLVTLFETFLKNFFKKYLQTNKSAYEKFIADYVPKRDIKPRKKLTHEQKFKYHLRQYTFQNLKSVQTAYEKYLNYNLEEVLNVELIHRGEITTIGKALRPILNKRHGKIHENVYDLELNKEKTKQYCDVIKTFCSTFIDKFMEKNNYKLLIEYELGY
ncbi:HEPN domain-containing protein [Priestia aryabhattai]|uniref:HEPN domain-containing protein n=1 Tax=Priestia aryabhattai TaxID=412384 RepID=UPI003D2A2E7F